MGFAFFHISKLYALYYLTNITYTICYIWKDKYKNVSNGICSNMKCITFITKTLKPKIKIFKVRSVTCIN